MNDESGSIGKDKARVKFPTASEMAASTSRGQRNKVLFASCLVMITLVRFYLLRGEDIITGYSGYDDHLFVQLGEHAFWWRPADETSLVRLPAYPLWIWLCHQTGIPLYLGTNVLSIAASLFLVYALRKLGLPRLACVAVYMAQLFELNSIDSMRRVVASNLYGILFIVTLASMALALASTRPRQLWIASAGLALSLGIFAITRAESILAWIALISFVAAVILNEVMAAGRKRILSHNLTAAGLLPALALIAAPLSIATANKAVFGVFTSCDLTSRGFTAAINQLLAIKPDKDIPYAPVTRDARKKAYAVSPAFEKLAPFLEGPPAQNWGRHASELYNVPTEEIGGGWFFFALRRAIVAITEARSPAQIHAYCQRIANEIGQAFKEGKLRKRRVWLSLVQPDSTIWSRIPTSLGRIFARTVSPYPPASILDVGRPSNPTSAIEETFDQVTYRRSLSAIDWTTISGWGFSNGEIVTSVRASMGDGTALPVTFKNFTRPAVFDLNKEEYPSLRRDAPFAFTATVPIRKRQEAGGRLGFIFGDGTEMPVNIANLQPKKFALGSNTSQQTGWLRIEHVTHEQGNRPDLQRAARQMAIAGKFYSLAFEILLVAVIPSLLLLGIFRDSPAHNRRLYLWLLPLIGFVAARVSVLAIIDASSFKGTVPGYLNTIAGPLAAAAIILNAQSIVVVRRRFDSKLVRDDFKPPTTAT
jgi:hypothetical protein